MGTPFTRGTSASIPNARLRVSRHHQPGPSRVRVDENGMVKARRLREWPFPWAPVPQRTRELRRGSGGDPLSCDTKYPAQRSVIGPSNTRQAPTTEGRQHKTSLGTGKIPSHTHRRGFEWQWPSYRRQHRLCSVAIGAAAAALAPITRPSSPNTWPSRDGREQLQFEPKASITRRKELSLQP